MRLTFSEFIDTFRDYFSHPYKDAETRSGRDQRDTSRWVLERTWTTGGAMGGNCWNDDPPESYLVDASPEPELDDLDKIFEVVAPGLTYIQYRKIATLFETVDYRTHEYYGNYYDHRIKMVDGQKLYDMLVEMGYIEPLTKDV